MTLRALAAAAAMVGPASAWAVAVPIDDINGGATPVATQWAATEAGWLYTPTGSYVLQQVQTRFGTSDGRQVDLEVWDEAPAEGGQRLRNASAMVDVSGLATWSLADMDLQAAEDYFIGFRRLSGLGVNFTRDLGATHLGGYWFGRDGLGTYGTAVVSATISGAQPILAFAGVNTVPAPSIALLVVPGLALLLAGSATPRRRCRSPRPMLTAPGTPMHASGLVSPP